MEATKIGNVMKGANIAAYVRGAAKTVSGNKTHDSGDKVAVDLRGLPVDDVYRQAAEATGETVGALKAKYGHLNVGMQRMNLGNRIRGAQAAKERPVKAPKAPKVEKAAESANGAKAAEPAKASTKPKTTVKIEAPKAPTKPKSTPKK